MPGKEYVHLVVCHLLVVFLGERECRQRVLCQQCWPGNVPDLTFAWNSWGILMERRWSVCSDDVLSLK